MIEYETLMELIGPIKPIGETQYDNITFENLKRLTEVVDKVLLDLSDIALLEDRPEFSIYRSGKFARSFFQEDLDWIRH